MNRPLDQLVRFGAFQLDLRTGELRKAGVRINLPEQPFQVLKALLDRPGELLTREELRQRLWPAETFVDFEHGLNAAVRRLRDALGDSADVPRFVETLPRRGYRFIASVTEPAVEHEPVQPRPEIQPLAAPGTLHPPSAAQRSLRAWAPALAAAVILVSGVILWPSRFLSAPPRFVLAVVPFANMTGEPGQEYVGDGMTDELITQLGMLDPRLGVISRGSARQFTESGKGANELSAKLGLSHRLEGSVRADGTRIVIDVQLIDTRNETTLWTHAYEQDATNVLTLHREVAADSIREITAHLGIARSTGNAVAHQYSTTREAYLAYARGHHHWKQDTSDGLDKAEAYFLEAIRLDKSFARAYSGLADTYIMKGSNGFLPMDEAYELARTAVQNALDRDERSAEAHTSQAAISFDYDWNWTKADHHFKRAVDLDRNYSTALEFYAFYLACMGRNQEALDLAHRRLDSDKLSPSSWEKLAQVHYFARRYDQAIVALKEALDLDEKYGPAHQFLGRVYVAKGEPERAIDELKQAQYLMGARPSVLTPLAYAQAKAGRRHEAQETLEELRRVSKPRPSPFRIAYVDIGLGNIDQAFDGLKKAVVARDWQMGMLKVEPAFDALRSDPRFDALLKSAGLPR
jgi:TolB-like protein/DNA-binding winged helix-turn-helix (wHTH) protein/Tfp pilus assembly protein PilF